MPAPESLTAARLRTGRDQRARVAALDDLALVAAMRSDDPYAWGEFFARHRSLLTAFARSTPLTHGLTDADVHETMVDEVLAEEAARLTAPNAPVIPALRPYLLRAARNRLFNLRRAAARRLRVRAEAPVAGTDGECVVETLCSAYVLRLSAGPRAVREAPPAVSAATGAATDASSDESDDAPPDATPVLRLAAALRSATTTDEQMLLMWVTQRVPNRTIAAWLGIGYDAATKRVWRLCRRLRAAAVRHAATLGPDERREIERFLRRAGALPPLVAAVPATTSGARVSGGPTATSDHA